MLMPDLRGHHLATISSWVSQGANFYPFPIRNTFVPQVGHTPCVADLPFFILMDLGLLTSTLALHFIQYACICDLLVSASG